MNLFYLSEKAPNANSSASNYGERTLVEYKSEKKDSSLHEGQYTRKISGILAVLYSV